MQRRLFVGEVRGGHVKLGPFEAEAACDKGTAGDELGREDLERRTGRRAPALGEGFKVGVGRRTGRRLGVPQTEPNQRTEVRHVGHGRGARVDDRSVAKRILQVDDDTAGLGVSVFGKVHLVKGQHALESLGVLAGAPLDELLSARVLGL